MSGLDASSALFILMIVLSLVAIYALLERRRRSRAARNAADHGAPLASRATSAGARHPAGRHGRYRSSGHTEGTGSGGLHDPYLPLSHAMGSGPIGGGASTSKGTSGAGCGGWSGGGGDGGGGGGCD